LQQEVKHVPSMQKVLGTTLSTSKINLIYYHKNIILEQTISELSDYDGLIACLCMTVTEFKVINEVMYTCGKDIKYMLHINIKE
jgi:hypothetical protein